MNNDYYNKYGHSLPVRISRLVRSLEGDEQQKAIRWAKAWGETTGKAMDFSSDPIEQRKVEEATQKNFEALRELEKIFFKKHGEHLVEIIYMLGLEEGDRWPSDEP